MYEGKEYRDYRNISCSLSMMRKRSNKNVGLVLNDLQLVCSTGNKLVNQSLASGNQLVSIVTAQYLEVSTEKKKTWLLIKKIQQLKVHLALIVRRF